MQTSISAVEQFLRASEQSAAAGDFAASAAQFADVFLTAGPQGALCVRVEDFARALPRRKQLFQELGCTSSQLVHVEERRLGERYCLAHTQWRIVRPPEEFCVESTFLVDTGVHPFKIVLYVPHQDIFSILKAEKAATA